MGVDTGGKNLAEVSSGADTSYNGMLVQQHVVLQVQRRLLAVRNVNCYAAVAYYLLTGVLGAIQVIQPQVIERFLSYQGFRHTIQWSQLVPEAVTMLVHAGIFLFVHLLVIWELAPATIRWFAGTNGSLSNAAKGAEGLSQDRRGSVPESRSELWLVTSFFVVCNVMLLISIFLPLFQVKAEYWYWGHDTAIMSRLVDIAQYGTQALFVVVMLVFPNCLMLCSASRQGCHQSLRNNMGKAMLATSVVVLASVLIAIVLSAATSTLSAV